MPEYSLVGRQDMGNSKIMIMDRGIADAGERNEGARLGLRSGRLNRRSFLFGSAAGLGALGLAGCATSDGLSRAEAAKFYGPAPNEKFPIPAVDVSKIDPKYFRQIVRYDSKEAPGTIIIDPANYYVYRIEGDGNATRYGANVSRPGFLWSGEAYVGRKAEWPTWTPPKEMIQRQPEARKYAGGMPGGLDNPLGARTLYLYQNGALHGLHDLQHQRPRDDRDRHYERLYRPPQSGHDRPLFANADQDEGGHAAGIANGVNWGAAFLVSGFFLSVVKAIGEACAFWLFAAFCVIGLVWVIVAVPEKRGRWLEEIEASWREASPQRTLHWSRERCSRGLFRRLWSNPNQLGRRGRDRGRRKLRPSTPHLGGKPVICKLVQQLCGCVIAVTVSP